MQRDRFTVILSVLAVAAVILAVVAAAGAGSGQKPTEQVLHTFAGGADGALPQAGLVFDGAGNLYGTTQAGGTACKSPGCGTVFELTPQGGGNWTQTILYGFSGGKDSNGPTASLVLDASGNLYGTTANGGTKTYGTVFQLKPQGGGVWTEKVLHSFDVDGTDGIEPSAAVTLDATGNVYGITPYGGANGYGAIFELAKSTWAETILYSFKGGSDGANPAGGLVFDSSGKLYGATGGGSVDNFGNVFELVLQAGGAWKERVMHNYGRKGSLGAGLTTLTLDAAGNVYGAAAFGGAHNVTGGYGAIVEVSKKAGGGWSNTVLFSFNKKSGGAFRPNGPLLLDAAGSLYGTTEYGGSKAAGTVFKLTQTQPGQWSESILYTFTGGSDGANPYGGLVMDASGNLYGTTKNGGSGSGVVFEITQ